MPDHVGDRGAVRLDPGASRSPTYQPDEYAQTSVSEHGDRHSPRPAGAPDGAEAARRVARVGRAAIRRQHPSSLRARRGRSLPWCGELTFRTPARHRAPEPGTWKDPDPRRRSSRGSGLRIGLPARRWRLRDACGLSRLNDFLAPWSQAYMSSCNRQVTSTSIHMARPGRATAPRGHAPL
jgi:hypothetical protein